MKFLVVDDSLTMRRIIINALQRIGYNDTIEASDGKTPSTSSMAASVSSSRIGTCPS